LTSFVHLLEYSLQRFSCEKVELLTVVARKVWLRRNSLIFEGCFQPPRKIWEEALSYLEDFKSSMITDRSPLLCLEVSSPSRFSSWKPPPHGKVKVNWDASINPKEKCIGVGIVARDSRGEFMGAQCYWLLLDTDPRSAFRGKY
jgi:hypothetical protein